ncbi:L-threonylcarbamoyladenylate synthase [Eisenibacter elegans]|jgi:L-threonylcarbamoyladenylate synthase|uniref:L-threonylcarbamoyladenylate synthase n=1 Tax=Eisenibacter elegans TaxID=997 RepID=UPI0003FFAD3C|nr:L-threonylcarbamoyladenylate synthase [Eisenibacter elegans]
MNSAENSLLGQAIQLLTTGELVGIPTETVYGLAANALDAQAVLKIFEAKNRPTFDPLIVHVSPESNWQQWVRDIPPEATQLLEAFSPGPITVLLPKAAVIPDLVTAGLDTVAIRIPKHPLTLALLAQLPFPLAAPSANPFGYISPTTAEHVRQQLGHKVKLVLDGGSATVGVESTIVGFDTSPPTVYRLGGVALEAIEAQIGPVQVQTHSSSNPKASGMLESHYAPRKPLVLESPELLLSHYAPSQIAALRWSSYSPVLPKEQQFVLSPMANLSEAARNLFAALRQLDASDCSIISAAPVPELGLGRAINDRLRRASAPRPE